MLDGIKNGSQEWGIEIIRSPKFVIWEGHFDLKWEPHLMRRPGGLRSVMNNNAIKTEQDLEAEDLG